MSGRNTQLTITINNNVTQPLPTASPPGRQVRWDRIVWAVVAFILVFKGADALDVAVLLGVVSGLFRK